MFIDTSIFEDMEFEFEHPHLKVLAGHIRAGHAALHLTAVTDGEIRQRIKAWRQDAQANHARIPSRARAGDKVDLPAADEFIARYEAFVKSLQASTHGAECVDAGELLRRYFTLQPPFSAKKKREFPDAIAVMILEHLSARLESQLCVVSHDDDWRAASERTASLRYFKGLAGLLMELRRDHARHVASFEEEAAAHAEGPLWSALDSLREDLRNENFYLLDSDPEGEVTEPVVEDAQPYGPHVLEANAELGTATVTLDAELYIVARADIGDEEFSFHDSETGDIHYRFRSTGMIAFERRTQIATTMRRVDGVWECTSVEVDPISPAIGHYRWVSLDPRNEDR